MRASSPSIAAFVHTIADSSRRTGCWPPMGGRARAGAGPDAPRTCRYLKHSFTYIAIHLCATPCHAGG